MDDMMMDAFVDETRDYYDEEEMQDLAEFLRGDYDEESASDFYEDWDQYEVGFDPYLGCYTDDC